MTQGLKTAFDLPTVFGTLQPRCTAEYSAFEGRHLMAGIFFTARRLGVVLCMCSMSATASAEWISLNGTSKVDLFYDDASVSQTEDTASLRYLSNMLVPHVHASAINHAEFHCAKRLMRITSVHEYAEQMGKGAPTLVLKSPLKWDSVARGTVADQLLAKACQGKPTGP